MKFWRKTSTWFSETFHDTCWKIWKWKNRNLRWGKVESLEIMTDSIWESILWTIRRYTVCLLIALPDDIRFFTSRRRQKLGVIPSPDFYFNAKMLVISHWQSMTALSTRSIDSDLMLYWPQNLTHIRHKHDSLSLSHHHHHQQESSNLVRNCQH